MTLMPSVSGQPMDQGLLSRALEIADRLAADASDVITATAGRGARPPAHDSPFDWVTDTHRTVERHTRRVLAEQFPGIPVFGAEATIGPSRLPADEAAAPGPGGPRAPAGLRWVVGAIDGNANFVAGVPWCAFTLALLDTTGPMVGVVADPFRGQVYTAARGRGMRANGLRMVLRPVTPSPGVVICTEFTRAGLWPGMARFIDAASAAHACVRVLGCSALAITQVALGHAGAAVLRGCDERDVSGALALAAEAGAVISGFGVHGLPVPPNGLLVAAPGLAEEVAAWWRSSTPAEPA